MSLYINLFIFSLLILALRYYFPRTKNFCYYTLLISFSLFLCLRFGQGSDYFGYWLNYDYSDTIYRSSLHGEFGWKLLLRLVKTTGLNYTTFIMIIGLFNMFCVHVSIKRYAKNEPAALVLLYPTIFLIYFMSGIRQAFVISLFISLGIDLLSKKKYLLYTAFSLFCMTFHVTAMFMLFIPLIRKIHIKTLALICFIIFAVNSSLSMLGVSYIRLLYSLLEPIMIYLGNSSAYLNSSVSWLGVIQRFTVFGFVFFLYMRINPNKLDEFNRHSTVLLMRIFMYGTLLYALTLDNSMIAGRISIYYYIVIFLLIPSMLGYLTPSFKAVALFLASLFVAVILVKNLYANISQDGYYSNVNVLNYPYVSVFNKDDIYQYRSISYTFTE